MAVRRKELDGKCAKEGSGLEVGSFASVRASPIEQIGAVDVSRG